MSFNKRYIDKNGILNNITNLEKYLQVDALICTDGWSRKFINDLDHNQRHLLEELNEETKYWSGGFHIHPNYNKINSLSEMLVNLLTDATWPIVDITVEKLKIRLKDDELGVYDLQKNKCIEAIINYYTLESREEILNSIL